MSWLSFHHEFLELNSGFHAWWQALLLAGPFCQPLKARSLKENSCWIESSKVSHELASSGYIQIEWVNN